MKIVKIMLALVSVVILVLSNEMIHDPITKEAFEFTYYYSVLLVAAFIYLHYVFHNYLIPATSSKLKLESQKAISNYYYLSFFKGTISVGYLFLAMSVASLLMSHSKSYLMIAVLFIIFGTASKARGLILFYQNDTKNLQKS